MNSLTPFASAVPVTMSSREIAELTGKQHAHVMRDIRAMTDQLSADPNLDWRCDAEAYTDEQGKTRDMYRMDKDTTLTLVSGYDALLRFRIIKRWQELESAIALPVTPALPVMESSLVLACGVAGTESSGYDGYASVTTGVEAITLGNLALKRHPCDTGAFFTSVISSMADCVGHPKGWSVPDSDCDNPVQSAAILLSPGVGGLQSKSGVPL